MGPVVKEFAGYTDSITTAGPCTVYLQEENQICESNFAKSIKVEDMHILQPSLEHKQTCTRTLPASLLDSQNPGNNLKLQQ